MYLLSIIPFPNNKIKTLQNLQFAEDNFKFD